VTEADGSGDGDPPAVEKFEPLGLLLGNGLLIGTEADWGRIVVTLAGAAAAAAACAPAFVFTVFAPVRAFVPICAAAVELLLELPSPPAATPVARQRLDQNGSGSVPPFASRGSGLGPGQRGWARINRRGL